VLSQFPIPAHLTFCRSYLILEYVQGAELFSFINHNGGLVELDAVWLFRQILGALIYCHRLNIHHRDLKPENILLCENTCTVKLVDFGMAALQPEGRYLSTPCGSPHYAAPEVIIGENYDGGKADVWSCGVILYTMLNGFHPFRYQPGESMSVLYRSIRRADYILPDHLSYEAKDLLCRILVPDPLDRITMEQVWYHPLMSKYNHAFPPEENQQIQYWMEPDLQLDDWNISKTEDIDTEILRNMRTLWHSEKEKTLIEKLLNEE
jgi:serine/threonine-protein kinase HSL1, negative regulator of Swe1 kinase